MQNLLNGKELRAQLESKESSLDDYDQLANANNDKQAVKLSSESIDSRNGSHHQSEGSILEYIKKQRDF